MNEDIRWQQRLENFGRAIVLLREAFEDHADWLSLHPLMKEGIIQRFEYTYELAWKTLKDKMTYDGLLLEAASPRYVFKLAHQQRYIDDIDAWLAMIADRNLMSHTYNARNFDQVLVQIRQRYFPMLDNLYTDLIALRI